VKLGGEPTFETFYQHSETCVFRMCAECGVCRGCAVCSVRAVSCSQIIAFAGSVAGVVVGVVAGVAAVVVAGVQGSCMVVLRMRGVRLCNCRVCLKHVIVALLMISRALSL